MILIALTFFGTMVSAQEASKQTKVAVKTQSTNMEVLAPQAGKDRKITRLYKFKNSRVKKALSFSTKNDGTKLA